MSSSSVLRWDEFSMREATISDLEIILHHRQSMFYDMGHRDQDALSAMRSTSRPFLAERLADGRYHAWLVENSQKQVVAGGGLTIFDYPSSPTDPIPKRAVIMNMYTDLAYRRRGLARKIVEAMINWCRKQGFGSVLLYASNDGRPLYEKLGFQQTNEMRLKLK